MDRGRWFGDSLMSRRDVLLVGLVVLLVAGGVGLWRSASGADAGTALRAGVWVVVVTGCCLAVNQLAARRRARRRVQ